MLDSVTVGYLNNTIKQFTDEGRMFTGYDVTLETRDRENIKLRHSDVREEIHDLSVLRDETEFGDYTRTERDMPGGGWAWVYHRKGDDPSNYVPRQSSQKPKLPGDTGGQVTSVLTHMAAKDAAAVDDGTQNDSGGLQSDGKYATDYRNRLMVTKTFLSKAGLNAGDTCYVYNDEANSTLVLKKSTTPDDGHSLVGSYLVERNGDIRLSGKTLSKLGTGNKFVIENPDDEQVKVKLSK